MTKASDVVVIGDRLFTDVMMANMMGAWTIWVKDGIVMEKGIVRTPCLQMVLHPLVGSIAYIACDRFRGWRKDFRCS